jgi:hypothetical protein
VCQNEQEHADQTGGHSGAKPRPSHSRGCLFAFCVHVRQLLVAASAEELRRPTRGTRWTNEQLLFHMLFGYLVVRVLLVLVRVMARLPTSVRRGFARMLDAATRPFDVVNFWGSRGGARVFNHKRMGRVFDVVVRSLHRRLDAETEQNLRRGMYFPPHWDPFFSEFMTLEDVYRFPAQHFDFHAKQLTFPER